MNAEIIAVGSEMLTPGRVDTNSLYLTGELNNLGVEVVEKCVVGDDLDRLAGAIRLALSRSQIVIVSGGLGPTEDDLTREATAQATGRKLVFQPALAQAIEERFARMKRRMAEVNKRQAFVIEGADVLPNDRGTAPGQWVEESGAVAMLLPGPPHELQAMFERQCRPRLQRLVPPLPSCACCCQSDLHAQYVSTESKAYLALLREYHTIVIAKEKSARTNEERTDSLCRAKTRRVVGGHGREFWQPCEWRGLRLEL